MIFAHGPFGFLTAYCTQRFWKKKFTISKKALYILFVVGFIGGIFPDIDLFYYYLVNASSSHREFITHTPIFYIVLCTIFSLFFWIIKKPLLALGALIFMLGAFSHLISDTIVAQIMFFYPFSDRFYGISDLNTEVINSNLLFLNFLLEGIFFFFFFYTFIWMFARTRTIRLICTLLLLIVFSAGVGIITYGNTRIYHGPSVLPYEDLDQDGISNYEDTDIDGDSALNMLDLDSDNDGKGNAEEIIENTEAFTDVWYDPSHGGLLQIPARLGFITNDDIVRRVYGTMGIFITEEMQQDYAEHPQNYHSAPTDSNFDRDNRNIAAWLEHTNRLETEDTLSSGRNTLGDILFFPSGYVAIVSGFNPQGETMVLDVHPTRGAHEVLLTEIEAQEGHYYGRGKILATTPLAESEGPFK